MLLWKAGDAFIVFAGLAGKEHVRQLLASEAGLLSVDEKVDG
jgi:hypothetical protein